MRRGLTIAALVTVCACAAPAAAPAQCGPPKGVYIANAEFANALYLFVGQAGDSLRNPAALASRAGAFAGAAAQYPPKVLKALSSEPPECGARPAPARRTRPASAARRR